MEKIGYNNSMELPPESAKAPDKKKETMKTYELPIGGAGANGLFTQNLKFRLDLLTPQTPQTSTTAERTLGSVLVAADKVLTALLDGQTSTIAPCEDIPLFINFLEKTFLAHTKLLKDNGEKDIPPTIYFDPIKYNNSLPPSLKELQLLYFLLKNKRDPNSALSSLKKFHEKHVSASN